MMIDDLKRELKSAITTQKGKFTFTGDIRVDLMADDCLKVIEAQELEIKQLKERQERIADLVRQDDAGYHINFVNEICKIIHVAEDK